MFFRRAVGDGDLYAVAGSRASGCAGGPATKAKLSFPLGVAVDGAGNLVIADTGNNRVRVVAARTGRFYRRGMTARGTYTPGRPPPPRGPPGRGPPPPGPPPQPPPFRAP